MSEPLPDLRATDADRERTAERLRRAAGDGQLDLDELDERLQQAYGARTRRELERLVADVQAPGDAALTRPAGAAGVTVRRGAGGARWLVAIMGGAERKGRWRLAARSTSLNIMGGSDLDLSQVELADDHVELTVYAFMGGADLYVPEGLDVDVSEFAFMGANRVDIPTPRSSGDGPFLRLRLISIMGGTNVKRGPKRSKWERRALRWHG
jgi:hypothetical protein